MNLWVRSQDKNKLVPINDELYIPNSRTGEDFGIFYKDKMLGYYKTKERTIEVLDEIQDKINLINLGYDFGSPMIDLKNPTYIYQMPEN